MHRNNAEKTKEFQLEKYNIRHHNRHYFWLLYLSTNHQKTEGNQKQLEGTFNFSHSGNNFQLYN